jgi:hypothetical protein
MSKAKVAAWRVRPETIHDDVGRLFELAGLEQALAAGAPTLLGCDVSWHHPFPAANTTPWQLDGSIRALRARGFRALSVTLEQDDRADVARAERENHYPSVLRHHGLALPSKRAASPPPLVEYRPRARLHVLHELLPDGVFLPEPMFGSNLLVLPTLKADTHAGVGGALASGLTLLGPRARVARGWLQRALVDLWAIRREIHPGVFALMDGTTAGPGPFARVPIVLDLMLASRDFVALDAVAARLMGLEPFGVEAIRLAHEDGLGVGDVREIDVVGLDLARENWRSSPGERAPASHAERLVDGVASPLQALWRSSNRSQRGRFLREPVERALTFGAELYRDAYRWPRRDRRTFERWRAETHWGALFAAYGQPRRGLFSARRA